MISVIVPVYNIIPYLPRCVHSIMNQSYRDLEIILVDDGSTDGTDRLCDELAVEDSRIRVFHKENGGSSSARNLGISKARGEYLGFIDSDDYIEPDMYQRLMEGIEKYHVKVAQIGRNEIDEAGNLLPDICIPPTEETLIGCKDFMKELLMHRGDCSFCTKLIHRDFFVNRQFPIGALNEDFHLLIEGLPQMGDILSLPGYGYHVFYRIGSNSRKETRDQFSRVFSDCVDNADLAMSLVADRYPEDRELSKIAFRFGVFQRIEYMLHIPIGQMNSSQVQYVKIVKWLRKNYFKALFNSVLTLKNKAYLTLFAIAPRSVRKLHKKLKKL